MHKRRARDTEICTERQIQSPKMEMEKHRQSISLRTGQTLQSFITGQQTLGHDDLQAVQVLLGQGGQIKKMDLVDRGLALRHSTRQILP